MITSPADFRHGTSILRWQPASLKMRSVPDQLEIARIANGQPPILASP
jgi:hypothetical protein